MRSRVGARSGEAREDSSAGPAVVVAAGLGAAEAHRQVVAAVALRLRSVLVHIFFSCRLSCTYQAQLGSGICRPC